MSLIKEKLRIAGWFAITNAAVRISVFLTIDFLYLGSGIKLKILNVFLSLLSLGLFVFTLSNFKKLLNYRFKFRGVDNFIYLIISSNILLYIILSQWFSTNKTLELLILTAFLLITLGIIYMVFAIQLFSLSDNLYGLLIPFNFTVIATGLCFATVIVLPLALFASVVSDVILGIIFFRAAKQS